MKNRFSFNFEIASTIILLGTEISAEESFISLMVPPLSGPPEKEYMKIDVAVFIPKEKGI
jgi:hypothetical protein